MRELDDQLSDADLDGMIEEIDGDGSGTVDFDGKIAVSIYVENSFFQLASMLTYGVGFL